MSDAYGGEQVTKAAANPIRALYLKSMPDQHIMGHALATPNHKDLREKVKWGSTQKTLPEYPLPRFRSEVDPARAAVFFV